MYRYCVINARLLFFVDGADLRVYIRCRKQFRTFVGRFEFFLRRLPDIFSAFFEIIGTCVVIRRPHGQERLFSAGIYGNYSSARETTSYLNLQLTRPTRDFGNVYFEFRETNCTRYIRHIDYT